jgi:L-glutamine-phosphate cytidylyltransferase
MRAIILAAGSGKRLNKYTHELPKGMLEVGGKPLLEHQLNCYRKNGVNDIVIVKGFMQHKISFPGITYYVNEKYSTTNMVESLFCSAGELNGDVIISYGDIIFDSAVLETVIADKHDISVVVDMAWKNYWQSRYGKIDFDTESLKIDAEGNISELGADNPPLETIDARYVGIIRLSQRGTEIFKSVYNDAKQKFSGKAWLSGRTFENIFMTDFLQELINRKYPVHALKINGGWLEFDTNEDYETMTDKMKNGSIKELISEEVFS